MLACGNSSVLRVTAGKQKAEIYSSVQLLRVSFVAAFDVTPSVFMLTKWDSDGRDWLLWFFVFEQEILCHNSDHNHETRRSLLRYPL